MTPVQRISPEFVETFPTPMRAGVLYVSIPYRTTGHLCCCGCGEEVIAPLAPAQWAITFDGDTVSLNPSIGNWSLPCKSHYVIRRNEVLARRQFSQTEIAENRADDRAALAHYDALSSDAAATPNPGVEPTATPTTDAEPEPNRRPRWWSRIGRHRSSL